MRKKHNIFKKRNILKINKIKFNYFYYKIILFKQLIFKYFYFYFFKKYLKWNFKLKYSKIFKLKIWIFFNSNFPISKKSKNSRMGKGKGNFFKWETKLQKNFILIKFFKLNFLRLTKLFIFWKKYIHFIVIQ